MFVCVLYDCLTVDKSARDVQFPGDPSYLGELCACESAAGSNGCCTVEDLGLSMSCPPLCVRITGKWYPVRCLKNPCFSYSPNSLKATYFWLPVYVHFPKFF